MASPRNVRSDGRRRPAARVDLRCHRDGSRTGEARQHGAHHVEVGVERGAVEDRRDDPAFDRWIEALEVTASRAPVMP